jgi:chromate transport protein ChrA
VALDYGFAGLGGGGSVLAPLRRELVVRRRWLAAHVLLDLVGRDWFVPVSGEVRQTVAGGLGLTIIFATPSH